MLVESWASGVPSCCRAPDLFYGKPGLLHPLLCKLAPHLLLIVRGYSLAVGRAGPFDAPVNFLMLGKCSASFLLMKIEPIGTTSAVNTLF